MKALPQVFAFIFLYAAAAVADASVPNDDSQPPALNCQVGPLHRTYGKTQWLVYACDDTRSVVIVTDAGNPGTPFYFIAYVKPDGTLRIYGEGTGKKSATQAAFDEIKAFSKEDVAALVTAAAATSKTP